MEPEIITAPVVAGSPADPGSQEVRPETQVSAEPQPTTDAKVERADNKPQAVETQRVKPVANFYRERERVRRLEQSYQELLKRSEAQDNLLREIRNPKPEVSVVQKLTAEELLNDPEKVFTSREQRLLAEFNSLKEELSKMKNQGVQAEAMKSEREALEMLFPKSSPDADESLEDRLENPERREQLERLLKANPSLDRLMRIDPKGAAEFVLEKLNKRPQASPNAIPKSLMGSTARGNPSGGTKTGNSPEDLMADYKNLTKEIELNPTLRFDKDHKAKRERMMSELDRLVKEKRD